MGHSGTRKRLKVRWMTAEDELDAHAFKIVDPHGALSDDALCGLPRLGMSRWALQQGKRKEQCRPCKQAMGRGARA